MAAPVKDPAAIAAEIADVRLHAPDALRRRWRAEFGRKPPAGLSRDLLGRMIAMRIQEQAFGGLDRESLTFLDRLARRGVSPHRHLKPGMVLVREYQGERHTVTVGREGFAWATKIANRSRVLTRRQARSPVQRTRPTRARTAMLAAANAVFELQRDDLVSAKPKMCPRHPPRRRRLPPR
jgi:hypothetical protein